MSKNEINNYNSFFEFAFLTYGDIQLNPGPTFEECFIFKKTLNKSGFGCIQWNLTVHNKRNSRALFNRNICSKCKSWKNLPFHNASFRIDHSGETESPFLEGNILSISSHNKAWEEFKRKGIHF